MPEVGNGDLDGLGLVDSRMQYWETLAMEMIEIWVIGEVTWERLKKADKLRSDNLI